MGSTFSGDAVAAEPALPVAPRQRKTGRGIDGRASGHA